MCWSLKNPDPSLTPSGVSRCSAIKKPPGSTSVTPSSAYLPSPRFHNSPEGFHLACWTLCLPSVTFTTGTGALCLASRRLLTVFQTVAYIDAVVEPRYKAFFPRNLAKNRVSVILPVSGTCRRTSQVFWQLLGSTQMLQPSHGCKAVSYTHLDVYKRQH